MEAEGTMQSSLVSVVEDVLQQHGKSLNDIDLASRKAHEAALRRNEAAAWLRKMVGFFGGRDLPDQPSEEEFRLGLRSGIVLCNVLNKVKPGAVPKVVEAPADSIVVPDGAALSVFQYFENVRNFLVSVEEMGLPSFEASDLEKGGKSSRIVDCILALKSYCNWKQAGGSGSWKFGGNQKPTSLTKQFIRRNADLFTSSLLRNSSAEERSIDSLLGEESTSGDDEVGSLTSVVRELLQDKKQEDIPIIVGSMLSKVMEEFEQRLTLQKEQSKTTSKDMAISDSAKSLVEVVPHIVSNEDKSPTSKGVAASKEEAVETLRGEKLCSDKDEAHITLKSQSDRLQMLTEKYQRDIQELKNILDAAKADVHFLKRQYQEEVSNLGEHLHGLTHAAQGYKKLLEENRKLYNLVQDLKGNIRVYCRVRPFLPGEANSVTTVGSLDDGNITIISPSKYGKKSRKTFTFNKVFGSSAAQVEVFSDTQPLIRSVLDGYNVCIFAYGQTGSGKTYTMSGPNDITDESAGVNYRALGDLFLISEQRKDLIAYDVSVQIIEIYNEQVRDLLATDGSNKRYPFKIRNNSHNGINVPDANIVPVASTSDVIGLMNLGNKNRAIGSTAMNDRSSRSHSCVMVHVQGRDLTSGSLIRGCMHLVDLAGSERVDKSEAVGDRLKEAQHINKSLSALGDVISSLSQKNAHVPYRNSKLTQLLQDSLGGHAKTLMFVHISPEPDSLGETISTLKFAERVSNVELGTAKVNKDSSEVRELKEQISTLKVALARKDGDSGHHQYSISKNPERFRAKSSGSTSPSRSRCMDEVESIEDRSNSTILSKTRSLDSHYLLTNSQSSPPIGSPNDDWVDKAMMNKVNNRWGEDNRQSSEIFGDIDDLDAATTDSSEPDSILQTNLSRISSLPNGLGTEMKSKKTGLKLANGQDRRSLIPTPTKKRIPNGTSPFSQKAVKSSISLDLKRKPGSGK
ncbi:microtubule binding motor protein [Lithospermum erythrorhizon]|uniref:Microtubule binding motor protein n=1 Tax=Lithospermum erythrorhizon TaxID=34254 RepID=A0AAV3PCS0_LITER